LLGETYLRLGQTKDARRQLEIVLESQPYNVAALVLMADVELQSGQPKQVLEYTGKIQEVEPDLYIGYQLAGDAWVATENYSKAEAAYSKAWALQPSGTLAIKYSDALLRSGKSEDASAVLLAWLDEYPDDASTLEYLGGVYEKLGQKDMAVETYEKLLAVQPDNLVALNNLAWLYSLGNNPKALGLAERAYQRNPESSGIQDTYGWLLVKQGDVNQGRRLLEQAMEELSEIPEVRYHYAVALLKSGEKTEANKLLNQLLQSEQQFEGRDDALGLLGGQ
jgi:tetratricopeptide (TPR) repeat protein